MAVKYLPDDAGPGDVLVQLLRSPHAHLRVLPLVVRPVGVVAEVVAVVQLRVVRPDLRAEGQRVGKAAEVRGWEDRSPSSRS